MGDLNLNLEELQTLTRRILVAHGTSDGNAEQVATALVLAEADGQKGHGASRIPSYAAQARSGKVDGHATPVSEQVADAALRIDARSGFAYPALNLAVDGLAALAPRTGIAAAAIKTAKVPTPAARASTVSDSDDSDDDAPKAKKKKKAKVDAGDLRAGAGGAAQKLQHLPARLWAPHELQPAAVRVLVPASELGDEGSAAVAALRRRLGVRVPDVRSRVCSFWLKGTCKRGEACAFAHSDSNVNLAWPRRAYRPNLTFL